MPRKSPHSPLVCEFFSWRLFQRAGVFYADGRVGGQKLGKHSLGTRDREEAIANLRRLDRQIAVQRGLAPASSLTPTPDLALRDGWELFLLHCTRSEVSGGVSAATHKRYRAVRDKHIAFAERRGVQKWIDVDSPSIEAYGAWLAKEGYANRTMYLELTLVKSVVLWLVKKRRLPSSTCVELELEKPQGTDTYCYSQQQVAAMVRHCRERTDLTWLSDVIVALACTGLRIGELAGLRWTDLDLNARMIRLTDDRASKRRRVLGTARRIKGRRNRALPIHSNLYDILCGLPRHSDGKILHGPRGGRLKPNTVRSIFVREVIEPLKTQFATPAGEIGFAHGRLHSFRHYFCSRAFLDGASEGDLKEWLGHRDSAMVAHYRHLGDEDSRRKMQQIDFLGQGGRAERPTG